MGFSFDLIRAKPKCFLVVKGYKSLRKPQGLLIICE